jgi:hypothetical protein
MKRPWQCVLQQMIFSHVKISYFLRVFKYDFSQWPKALYNTYNNKAHGPHGQTESQHVC